MKIDKIMKECSFNDITTGLTGEKLMQSILRVQVSKEPQAGQECACYQTYLRILEKLSSGFIFAVLKKIVL